MSQIGAMSTNIIIRVEPMGYFSLLGCEKKRATLINIKCKYSMQIMYIYLCNTKEANQFPESMLHIVHDIFRVSSVLIWLHDQHPREFTWVLMDMFACDLHQIKFSSI